jgi:hypothetical protein
MPPAVVPPVADSGATHQPGREQAMPITLRASRRWGIVLIAAAMCCGMTGITPVAAQSVPVAPVVVIPIVSGNLTVPVSLPSVATGVSGRNRDGLIWSTRGRADVDVSIDEHHGRTVVP